MTTAGRKPHVPRNATAVKAGFSRVYFQNVRLLSAGALRRRTDGSHITNRHAKIYPTTLTPTIGVCPSKAPWLLALCPENILSVNQTHQKGTYR